MTWKLKIEYFLENTLEVETTTDQPVRSLWERVCSIIRVFFNNSRLIRRILQDKIYFKIQRLDQGLNQGHLSSCQSLTITLECFLCLCESVIASYSCINAKCRKGITHEC